MKCFRSQADIMNQKPIDDCLRDEQSFLQRKYPTLASRNGIPYLSKTLNRVICLHYYFVGAKKLMFDTRSITDK